MERGTERLFPWSPISWAVRRSSDGLWEIDGNVLPWFWYKSDKPGRGSIKLGEYMFYFAWLGGWPFRLPVLKLICWLSCGRYVLKNRDTEEK